MRVVVLLAACAALAPLGTWGYTAPRGSRRSVGLPQGEHRVDLAASLVGSISPVTDRNPIVRREAERTIRLATLEDLPSLAEHRLKIFRNIVPPTRASRTYNAIFDGLLTNMRNRYRRNGTVILLATRDENALATVRGETLMGNVELSSHQLEGSTLQKEQPDLSRWYLTEMAVNSAYRRRGVAFSMLQCAEMLAKERGIDELLLHVDSENKAAVQLYRKAGFEVMQETPEVVEFTQKMGLLDSLYAMKHHHLMRMPIKV